MRTKILSELAKKGHNLCDLDGKSRIREGVGTETKFADAAGNV
jgi:hypothetical protein